MSINKVMKHTILTAALMFSPTLVFAGDPVDDGNKAMNDAHEAGKRGDAFGAARGMRDARDAAARAMGGEKGGGNGKDDSGKDDE